MSASVTQLTVEVVRARPVEPDLGAAQVTQLVVEALVPFVPAGVPVLAQMVVRLTAAASANSIADVSGSAQMVVRLTAWATRPHPAVARLVVTAAARSIHGAVARLVVTAAAAATKTTATSAVARLVVRARARNLSKASAVPGEDLYLGRFQLGQEVPIWLQCFHEDGYQGMPDRTPTCRLYRDDVAVGGCEIAHLGGSPGRFGGLYLVGSSDLPGRYVALLVYETRGTSRLQIRLFEVVEGGDYQGAAISSHSVSRPDGDQILVHVGAGALLMGRAPYLDEGL